MRVGSSAAFGESSASRSSGTAQVSVRKSPLTSGRRASSSTPTPTKTRSAVVVEPTSAASGAPFAAVTDPVTARPGAASGVRGPSSATSSQRPGPQREGSRPDRSSRSPFASSTAASRTISVPNLVDRNPTARRGSPTSRARSPLRASRSSRVHSLVPSPTQLTVTMRSSAGRRPIESDTARSSTMTCPTRRVVSAALARAMPRPVSRTEPGLAAIRRAATARGARSRRVIA